ncbi:MAG: hypothetical protein WC401_06520 [Bacteroidales bacterium]
MDKLKIEDGIVKQRYIINKAKTKASLVLMFAPNILINILMVVALMAISMLSKDNEFTWDSVFTWYFLFVTVALIIIYQITHWASFDSKLKKLNLYDENITFLETQEDKIKETTGTVEWKNNRTAFVKERNEKQKIIAWQIYIQNTITKLTQDTNKYKKKSIDLENEVVTTFQRNNLPPSRIKEIEDDIKSRQDKNRYIRQKRVLEDMLDDKWIAEHINKVSIDYNNIDINFIETGDIIKGQTKDRTKKHGKYAKDNMPNRLLVSLITFFISIFTADMVLNWSLAGWVDFVLRIAVLLVNMLMGSNYATEFYVDTDIHNSKSRVEITNEFWVWLKTKI